MPASHGEFDLIRRHFRREQTLRQATLGIGDDCALLAPAAGQQLAISTDLLVAGRHFFADVDPATLGHKSLAVNLSDLAACGARPLACTLSLALPEIDDDWLQAFAAGLFALADAHGCELIGGDTTRGPLTIGITVFGEVPQAEALLRSGARPGDGIYVSHGPDQGLGDARLALQLLLQDPALVAWPAAVRARLLQATRARLEQPEPRVALGLALRSLASACCDLSDGLSGDLRHILDASGCAAVLQADALWQAASPALRQHATSLVLAYALAGGDDYELLWTAPPERHEQVLAAAHSCGLQATRIGQIEAGTGLRLQQADGSIVPVDSTAFDHFR
ncbi:MULTISPECIES: thiamine-phosphate kinase [Brachymonas]|uniref:thiamine-phosphate kinase n=1 Tax=Brachymonas TaxID=28219 RepID=UPI002E76CF27|nr:thiamine-phosphate kinase [Brachymonas sp. J145]MEE1654471.1 thiamine-phosphate kinase [Brachymonas sp. J145]